MFPILLTIGNFPISSFGLFLGLGIFFGAFSVWRIARSFDFDFEKVLDLIFLVVGSGFVFSRIGFVLMNLGVFDSFTKIFFVNRYPGLSFWGGILGGILALWWFARRAKLPYLQVADIAMVGFLAAGFWVEIGCLLGGCGVGVETTSIFSVDQAGSIGKRFPIQIFEAVTFLGLFFAFWKAILRFHIQGSFFAKGLIWIGVIKFLADFFKAPGQLFRIGGFQLKLEMVFSVLIFILGFYYYYRVNKRTPLSDLATFFKFFVSRQMQKSLATKVMRGWYNQKANLTIGLGKAFKRLFKSMNMRSNPEKF